jgi:hypothetical protein
VAAQAARVSWSACSSHSANTTARSFTARLRRMPTRYWWISSSVVSVQSQPNVAGRSNSCHSSYASVRSIMAAIAARAASLD